MPCRAADSDISIAEQIKAMRETYYQLTHTIIEEIEQPKYVCTKGFCVGTLSYSVSTLNKRFCMGTLAYLPHSRGGDRAARGRRCAAWPQPYSTRTHFDLCFRLDVAAQDSEGRDAPRLPAAGRQVAGLALQ
jgi:hypothetical protein